MFQGIEIENGSSCDPGHAVLILGVVCHP